MSQTLPKVAGVELNHEVKVFINTTPTGDSATYKSMCNAFKNCANALNENVYSASYLSDGGYSSSTVTGFQPTITLQGDFMASDPVCAYLDKIQWSPGAARVTDIKMNRNGQIVTCPVTLTQIAIAGGESTAPNAVTVVMAMNGKPTVEDGKLYGLGSNDAGASVVCLLETFLTFRTRPLPFNLVLGISAEEECMGENGIRALLPALGKVDMALVGEPTGMQAATGERGLVVLDCTAHGRSGHAARGEGVNALYIALDDIARLRSFRFGRESELLGPIGIAVTQIEAGTQHNVVPDTCRFVVDVRTTDAYSNEETVGILRAALRSEAVPRSTRIRAAAVGGEHPLVKAAVAAGRETYVSPTTSDRTLMPFPALKMGPGQSSRSHTADEFVLLEEIAEGIAVYEKYIGKLAQEYGWKTLG